MSTGAEGGQESLEERMLRYREDRRRILTLSGVLDETEIEEYLRYEFDNGALVPVGNQVRRYYLKMKDQRFGERAEEMLAAVGEIDETTMNAGRAKEVERALRPFVSGGLIHYDGELYHQYGVGADSLGIGSAATGHMVAWSADDPSNTTLGDPEIFGRSPHGPQPGYTPSYNLPY